MFEKVSGEQLRGFVERDGRLILAQGELAQLVRAADS